jgi:hypothetical protein
MENPSRATAAVNSPVASSMMKLNARTRCRDDPALGVDDDELGHIDFPGLHVKTLTGLRTQRYMRNRADKLFDARQVFRQRSGRSQGTQTDHYTFLHPESPTVSMP